MNITLQTLLTALVFGLTVPMTVSAGRAFAGFYLEAPTYIETAPQTDGSVRVTWNHAHTEEQGYIVFRRLRNEQVVTEVARLRSPLPDPAEYIDRSVPGSATAYQYRICAFTGSMMACSEPPYGGYALP